MSRWLLPAVLLWPALIDTAIVAGDEHSPIHLLASPAIQGRLTDVSPNWQMSFSTDAGRRTVSLDDLILYGAYRDSDVGPQVLLADGGLLRSDVLEISGDAVIVESRLWFESRIRLGLVRAVVFQPPADYRQRDAMFRQIRESSGGQDRLLLSNGDAIIGQLVAADDGRLWSSELERRWRLRTAGRELEIPWESVVAVVFNPSLVERVRPRSPNALVGFGDGSRLNVEQFQKTGETLHVRLAGGVELTLEPPPFGTGGESTVWSSVESIQPIGTPIVYLSDLKSASFKHIPLLDRQWPYQVDASVAGGLLRVAGRVYTKGIGMHSTSRLAYALGGRFQRFEAELGIDDAAADYGSVIFRVFVNDSQGEWQLAYESPVVRAGQSPLPMSVDIRGVRAAALIVDAADRGDIGDHADWLNARLIPD